MRNKNKKTDHFYNSACRYLSYKPRTIREMKTYLAKKGVPENQVCKIIDDLTEQNFLDDDYFARWYIENRVKFKPRSKFALAYELKQKGISQVLSGPVLSELDDYVLAKKAIQPKLNHWKNLNNEVLQKKILNYLSYRGFPYSICQNIFEQQIKRKENNL